MELINGAGRWRGATGRPLILALGNFDGVHRGHQAILQAAVEQARARGGRSAALIFDPHPSMLLRPSQNFALLTEIADRAELMARLGLDYLIVEPFTETLAALAPERFVRDILAEKLRAGGAVIGYDYSFGRGGLGRAETMVQCGKELGLTVTVCPPVRFNGDVVSSSAVRALLMAASVGKAAELLGYHFFRRGKVISGSGIGRKMVFPTANLDVLPGLIWPGKGVYLTAVGGLGEKMLYGVTNVGARPTFACSQPSVETHILDFNGDIYHRELCLYFLEKLRETRAFASPRQLKEQICLDIERGRELIATRFQNPGAFPLPPTASSAGTGPLKKIQGKRQE